MRSFAEVAEHYRETAPDTAAFARYLAGAGEWRPEANPLEHYRRMHRDGTLPIPAASIAGL